MEGEKEEKEEEEEEKELHPHVVVAAASSMDYQDLPIMHWEDLSQRIAELEKQEQERRERAKRGTGLRTDERPGGVWRDVWQEEQEEQEEEPRVGVGVRRCRIAVVTSRFHNHRNLQLCFINKSDSEDEEEEEEESDRKQVSMGTGPNGCHAAGLKQEVATALRTLRDKLLAEQKEKEHVASSSGVAKRKHLERWELQDYSVQHLIGLRGSLQQDVHALSSELVTHLLVRDQLRTTQDAMLLDVQDLT